MDKPHLSMRSCTLQDIESFVEKWDTACKISSKKLEVAVGIDK